MGDKTSGRWTHHPTQAHMWDNNGRQGAIKHDKTLTRRTHHPTQAHMWGDSGRQDLGKIDTATNTGTHVGRQLETSGDNGRQDLRKIDTATNTGTHAGRQWETRGDKTSRRRTHHPTQAHMWGDDGKADTPSNRRKSPSLHLSPLVSLLVCFCWMIWMVHPPSRGFVSACPRKETRGDKGRQGETRGDKTPGRRTHHPTKGHKKGDTGIKGETRPSGRRTHHPTEGNPLVSTCLRWSPFLFAFVGWFGWCVRLREVLSPLVQERRQGETRGDKTPGRRTHHPTKGDKKGDTGIKGETRPSGRRTHHLTKGSKKGYNGRPGETRWETKGGKTLRKADTASNKGKQEQRQSETRPWGRWTHHPTKGN